MAGIPKGGFKDGVQLEAWLDDLPEGTRVPFARVIANKAALRALPFIADYISGDKYSKHKGPDLTLTLFQVHAISRAARKYQGREIEAAARNAARTAARTAASAADAAVASAARAADAAARTAAYAAADGAAAARAAARAADVAADRAAYTAMWKSVTADARAMEASGRASVLAAPLWPEDAPDFWQGFDRDFRRVLTEQSIWTIWLEWWQARVDGAPSWGLPPALEQEVETRIALGDGRADFWDREPAAVNAEIAGWVEDARTSQFLQNSENGKAGEIWRPENGRMAIAQTANPADAEIAGDAETQFQLRKALERLKAMEDFALQVGPVYGWGDFGKSYAELIAELDVPAPELPSRINRIYDAVLAFGSYLEFDANLRKHPKGNIRCLDADHRRLYAEAVRTIAPWVRRFPSARQADEETGNLLGSITSAAAHLTLIDTAAELGMVNDADRTLMHLLLSAMERQGIPAQKAGMRGKFSVRNLVLAAALVVIGGGAQKTDLYDKITDWMAMRFDQIAEVMADAPSDLKAVIEDMLEEARQRNDDDGDDPEEPPVLPPNDNRRRRKR